ncbi:MAG: hypothetical protein QOC97_557, partial [Chloroflexota bacterium]|nr:hypothetical protein [Chloroflexota bacterium]
MERLVGWYRLGSSSYGAVAALLVANSIPLVGVLFLGWNVWTILTIYWLENGVVGVFNVLKMARAEGPMLGGAGRAAAGSMLLNGRPIEGSAKVLLIPFFIVHYGLFWLVHGVFILTLPLFTGLQGGGLLGGGLSFDPESGAPVVGSGAQALVSDPLAVAIVIVGLFISHGISYRLNYIGRGEYLRTSVARQMAAPYGRLFILHITIILGGLAIVITGAPAFAVLVLVLLKTALDLGFHLAE